MPSEGSGAGEHQQDRVVSKSSYDHGPCPEPLIGRTIFEQIELVARRAPSQEALVSPYQNARLSFEDLLVQSSKLAKAMVKQSIARGDRIGIWSTNNWQWFVIFLAAAKIGAIMVNINPGYRTRELEYALTQSGIKLLFTIASNRSNNYLTMLNELATGSTVKDLERIILLSKSAAETETVSQDLPGGSQINELKNFGGLTPFDAFVFEGENISGSELAGRRARVQFDDPVNIQYTSGTTGHPKGVTLSHHNLVNNAYFAARAMGLDSDSRFCVPMPFYHCGGMISSALAALVVGGTVVIPGPFFQELETLQSAQNERCTHMSGVPTMFIAQLDSPDFEKFDLSSLRGGFMAGAPCPVQLMRRVASEMHMEEVIILYGLTESSPLMTAAAIDDSLEIRATTVGRIIPGIELKIVNPENGEIVPRGVHGEICCRGHNVMLGYWNNESATKSTIDSAGWLHSGDLGVMNAAGYLNITGRSKDMICRGGENVYPREIEEVLHTHPSISQAQVFGVPDAHLGEEVALWYAVKPGCEANSEEIRTWLKDKMAHFKVPKYIKVVSEFPMTVTGKIQKFVMRAQMIEELGLQSAADIRTA